MASTLVAKGHPAFGQNNGLHVTLQPDGSLTSWIDESPAPPDQPQPDVPDTAARQAD
ncbi:hypothetical protein [Streptomyces cupreus]|uniref:Uncharacterized protein n=1 Tax=Streptomyces cupreus TaxID=2759956 RepID=A0A7X1JCB7_9ACTN|nr:hypothetical protein [Streptomyces cupreus]MBC2908146.1 hypothetical protein [Streptomyces cupreus]